MKFLSLVILALVASSAYGGKICPELRARLEQGEVIDVMIQLPSVDDVFDSPSIVSIENKEVRIATMISTLKARAEESRAPFVNILTSLGLGNQRSITKPLWISNRFEVRSADLALVDVLARVPGEFLIRQQKEAHIIDPLPGKVVEPRQAEHQWGIEMTEAHHCWENQTDGTGVVVGIIDTGVFLGHEGLTAAYANGNNSWSDPYYNTLAPTDQQSHGTHCIGSTLGRSRGTGMAPGAQWVACRGLNHQGSGYEPELLGCAQWMLAECFPRPNVVTNSWGGGSGDSWYNDAMRAWIIANIVPVFAMGNSGSSCGSANSPGDQIHCIGVGATTVSDTMASFSSRGPAQFNGQKPEISAPGQDVISCGVNSPTEYTSKSGTSMATPHVAGLVALIMSQHPDATYQQIKMHMQETADHPEVSAADRACSDINAPLWPNFAYGHGRINASTACHNWGF